VNLSTDQPIAQPIAQPPLIAIAGPTGSGKSGLAMALAQRWQAVIVSADSRQVYREFDIGTAKPSKADQQQVPHRLIDICEPTETLTIADYQQQAQAAIAQLQIQSTYPILVGGSGLYLDAVTKGLKIPRVPPNEALRSQFIQLGQPYCYALLQQIDPAAAGRIHANDQVRTLRALEVFYVTGQPISQQQGAAPPSYPLLYIGLACEVQALRDRLTQRTRQMVAAGLTEEVAQIMAKYGPELPLLKTLGYAEIQQYIEGELSLAEATEAIIQHSCQFAKRQRTWFRKDTRIEWFAANDKDLVAKVSDRVETFLAKNLTQATH
jgi:tRNA dimethylallyltransferase